MAKVIRSFRLEERQDEVLRTRTKMLGVKQSEYIRSLIDADQRVPLRAQYEDMTQRTINARSLSLSEITIAVIEALRRENDTTRNKKRPAKSIQRFALKYDFQVKVVKDVLAQLVRNGILITEETDSGKTKYLWTYLGVAALPEYAPIGTAEDSLVSGSACGALAGLLGDYDEMGEFLASILEMDKVKADMLLRFFLQNYEGYFAWLRELIFPLTGVHPTTDQNFYRNQMLDYILTIISNYGDKWQDWKTNDVLNLREIALQITEYKTKQLS